MHTDAERKYAAKAARVRRACREDGSSLLDCTRRWKGSMQLKLPASGARAGKMALPCSIAHADGKEVCS